MFTHDDVYDALNPTPMCHIRRVIVLNYSTFRCRIVSTICIVITLESDNPMCSVCYLTYSTFRCRIVFTICIVITLESDNPMCSVLLFD